MLQFARNSRRRASIETLSFDSEQEEEEEERKKEDEEEGEEEDEEFSNNIYEIVTEELVEKGKASEGEVKEKENGEEDDDEDDDEDEHDLFEQKAKKTRPIKSYTKIHRVKVIHELKNLLQNGEVPTEHFAVVTLAESLMERIEKSSYSFKHLFNQQRAIKAIHEASGKTKTTRHGAIIVAPVSGNLLTPTGRVGLGSHASRKARVVIQQHYDVEAVEKARLNQRLLTVKNNKHKHADQNIIDEGLDMSSELCDFLNDEENGEADDQFEVDQHETILDLYSRASLILSKLINLTSSNHMHSEGIELANSIQANIEAIQERAIVITDWDIAPLSENLSENFVFTSSQNPNLIQDLRSAAAHNKQENKNKRTTKIDENHSIKRLGKALKTRMNAIKVASQYLCSTGAAYMQQKGVTSSRIVLPLSSQYISVSENDAAQAVATLVKYQKQRRTSTIQSNPTFFDSPSLYLNVQMPNGPKPIGPFSFSQHVDSFTETTVNTLISSFHGKDSVHSSVRSRQLQKPKNNTTSTP